MLKIKLNGIKTLDVEQKDNHFIVDGNTEEWDIKKISEGEFHIIHNHNSYLAQLLDFNADSKTISVRINGNDYQLEIRDRYDQLLKKLGMTNSNAGKVNIIKAPMPGLVLEVKAKEGNSIKKNDPVLILEAMKMENILKAPCDGIVKSIKVKKGDAVEKSQVLIVME